MKYKLSDICHYRKGKVDVSLLTDDTYISTENMIPNRGGITKASTLPTVDSTQLYKKGDILVSNIRPYFKKIWQATCDGGCSNDVLVFQANEGFDQDYLYYVLSDDAFFAYAMKTSKGTKMPRGDKHSIMQYETEVCDLATQRKIASLLKSIDSKIELNNAINNNLEQQARALFVSWFINFDPWNGVCPNEWSDGVLGDYVTIKRGGSPRPIQDYLSDTGYRWLKISDATAILSPFILSIKEHIKESGLSKTVFLRRGALVLSNSATPGIPKILDIDSCIHDGWLYFPESKFSNEYLYLFFKEIRSHLVTLGNGSVFTNLKTDILKNYPVRLPSDLVLKDFDAVVKPLFRMILHCTRENQHLCEVRDTLIPKFLSGVVDVSEVSVD